jgi:LL-diaminopimelate aminotransferase
MTNSIDAPVKPPSKRMGQLTTQFFASIRKDIERLQRAGFEVIRLDEGSPDLPPPAHIIAALADAAKKPDRHAYQAHHGPQALRSAWAKLYKDAYGVELNPELEILPLIGSKEGIFHFTLAQIDPGDIVLVPDPGYMTYTRAASFSGAQPFHFPLLPERGYLPDLNAIPAEVARRSKLIWLNYPNNPTSAIATQTFFSEVLEFARRFGILVCHDAAYTQVSFTGATQPSILQFPGAKEIAVEFNTLSKSHNMAGWRVGAIMGNSQAVQILYQLKTNVDSSHFLPIMEAAVVAMTSDQGWIIERNRVYQRRSRLVLEGLNRIGLAPVAPQASLYVWSPCPPGWTSLDFTQHVLNHAHVSLTPGIVFGSQGEGFFRLSFTAPETRLAEAMERLLRMNF